MIIILFIMLSYIMGSIPFGYIVGKHFKGIDIREHGSGNIGVANVLRVLGIKCALLVLIGDCLKGIAPLALVSLLKIESIGFYLIIGTAAIIGHNWSVFLKFKGGKGIATTYGVVLFFYPYIAIISALIWLIIVIFTKFAALGSLLSILIMFLLSFLFITPVEFKIFIIIILIFAIIRHYSNIKRLIKREEHKIV